MSEGERWRLSWEGERPERADVELSEFSPRLPDAPAYTHQVETVERLREANVLLTAGMGAGKTEAALAAVEHLGLKPAVFVYPTKALARDQAERMIEYGFHVVIADGDHPGWRSRIDDAELVLTNPQMIWVHAQEGLDFWRFLKDRAACVVWDEVHFYDPRQANLLLGIVRALRDRRHLFMSGTVGHPDRFCREVERATGVPCAHVRGRGKMAPRTFRALDSGSLKDLIREVAECAERGEKTLVFLRSRAQVEHTYQVLRRRFGLEDRVTIHHGALPREERWRSERAFKSHVPVMLTVKTLEVGIDIGSVSRVIHYGLPEKVSDFWQREGRAGRRGQPAESLIFPADPWTRFVTSSPTRFRRAYLEGQVERILADHRSPTSAPPDKNPSRSFYGEKEVYRVVRADDPRRLLKDQLDPEDVPRSWAPGCAFRYRGDVWIVVGPPDEERRTIPALPAEEYDPSVRQLIDEGWWPYPRIEIEAEAREGEDPEGCGLGHVKIRWTDTVLVPPPDVPDQPILLESGDLTVRIRAFYVRLHDPRLRSSRRASSAELAIHALTYALKLVSGAPLNLIDHYVHESAYAELPEGEIRSAAYMLLYEAPPAVMPLLEWERAALKAEQLIEREAPENLRLPRCPWPSRSDPDPSPRLARQYLHAVLERIQTLRERVRREEL
ncbi:helicase-related protein [Methanopyrus sp.]